MKKIIRKMAKKLKSKNGRVRDLKKEEIEELKEQVEGEE